MTKTTGVEAQVSIIRCPKCGGEMRLVPTLEEGRLMKMKISEIHKPRWYFRQGMGQDLDTLAVSLAAGQEEPIEVYEVDGVWYTVDGWRRISAAFLAGMEEIEVRKYKGDDPLLSALVRATFDRSHDVFEKGEGYWGWLEEKLAITSTMEVIEGDAGRKRKAPDPYNFVTSHRRQGSWDELNKAMGDPLGELKERVGSLQAVEHCLAAYSNASAGLIAKVRTGLIAPTTAREISEGLRKWKSLQDRVVEKVIEEDVGRKDVVKACRVLRKVIREYDGDEEAIDAVLEDDWTHTEEQLLRGVGIYKEVLEEMRGQRFYDETPEFKELVKTLKNLKRDLAEVFDGLGDASFVGKMSPEGSRFIIKWLRDLANSATDLVSCLEEDL